MNKNPLSANYTGSGSKPAKRYYSDKDAGKRFFKPDHSEFYPGSKEKKTEALLSDFDNTMFDNPDYNTTLSNEESSRPEIETIDIGGATSVRVKTAKEIAAELNPRNVINRGSVEKKNKHKKELVDVMLDGDGYEDFENLPKRGNMQNTNQIKEHDPKRPHGVRRMGRSLSSKNSKTNNNYRPWQEEQRNGGEDQILLHDMETNPDNIDFDIPMSPLEIALENKPNFIRDETQDTGNRKAA